MKYCIALVAFISCYCCICHALPTDDRTTMMHKIISKICSLAKSSYSKAKTPAEKEKILGDIEFKLLRQHGHSEYSKSKIRLILGGVKSMALNNDYRLCDNKPKTTRPTKSIARNGTATDETKTSNETAKQNLLKEMSLKIEKLAGKSFKNTSTIDEKKIILENIQKRLIETVKEKDKASRSSTNKTDAYVSLIMEGIKQVIEKTVNDSRRMTIIEFHGKPANDFLETDLLETDDINNQIDLDNDIDIENISHSALRSLTTEADCTARTTHICSNLKSLNEFVCTYDDTIIPLEHVCDGSVACPDGSDEKNCAVHAVERVHTATGIISSIEQSQGCFTELISSKHLEDQEKMLKSFLKQQLDFIKKHGRNKSETYEYYGKSESIVDVAGDVLTVVRSFAMVLKGALCDMSVEESEHILAAYDQDLEKDFEKIVLQGRWYPKSCICSGQICKDNSCPHLCKRLCFQKHSLQHWSCQTVTKNNSLSLDLVCDGKLDCYDETDEIGCATDSASKFEASSIFGNVITELSVKSKLKEYETVWKHILLLKEAIKKIQERSMKPKVNTPIYKADRDKVFNILVSTYVEYLDHNRDLEKSEPIYKFLLYISEKLIGALKRSQMGNEKVISDDECFCRGSKCTAQRCPKKCATICSVTPALTSYGCGISNFSVTIDTICNAKEDCPNGEDEMDCKKEICRAHHLKVLRHNIQNVGKKHTGTMLGEVLDAWKSKAISRLMVAEKRDRPTPAIVRNVVKNILSDLVRTYTSLEEIKKLFNAEDTMKKFKKLSQRIIETLKSCAM